MKQLVITDAEFKGLVHKLCRDITNSDWKPDYVVGLTRGGLIAATMISHYFKIPCETLKVSLRDGGESESNCWMAEDAFGYIPADMREGITKRSDATYKKNILIVDDINDSGATLQWIVNDWKASCLPTDPDWNYVWGRNVRVGVLVNNEASNFEDVNYTGTNINKLDDPCWVVFPWERWWEQ